MKKTITFLLILAIIAMGTSCAAFGPQTDKAYVAKQQKQMMFKGYKKKRS